MFLYNLVVRLYSILIHVASLNKPKAKQWVNGRRNWLINLQTMIAGLGPGKRIWVHCASYGEFEQGRPLIEGLKKKYPAHKIILTFFSPSGYEAFSKWEGADIISYLPLDTKQNAKNFLSVVQPSVAIFIKYEFWINFLSQLRINGIPTFLVSAVFKQHHPFFRSYGSIFRRSLKTFKILFIQDEGSAKLLETIGITNYQVTGDTRFDRVLEIKEKFREIPLIKEFKGTSRLIIAGSTWPKDEELVIKAFISLRDPGSKLVLVPHHVDEKSIAQTVSFLKNRDLPYTLYTEGLKTDTNILVVNTIGILSRSYFYADCAYIGGGFNEGLHNTLEPAVYNIPVAFYGKGYTDFNEAVELKNLDAATLVSDEKELSAIFSKFLNNTDYRAKTTKALTEYFRKNSRITERILAQIEF